MRAVMMVGAGVLAVGLLAGCGQAVESAVENATGTDIEVSDGGGSITFDNEGEEMTVSTGDSAQMPDAVPSEFPTPDGARLAAVTEVGDGSFGLVYEWPDGTEADFLRYLASVDAAGFLKEGEIFSTDMGPDAFQAGGQFAGYGYSMYIVGFGDGSMVQMTVTASPEE